MNTPANPEPCEPTPHEESEGNSNHNSLLIRQLRAEHSGPLPPPALLKQYDDIISNGAERIMQMAESEQQHRHDMERQLVNQEINDAADGRGIERRGQIFAVIVCLSLIYVAREIALAGNPGYATLLAGGTLASIITAFISGKFKGEKKQDDEGTEEG